MSFGNSLDEDDQWSGTVHKVGMLRHCRYDLDHSALLDLWPQYALYSRALTSSYLDALFGMGNSPASHCTGQPLRMPLASHMVT